MELTNSQLLLLAAFNEAMIRKQEAAVLLRLLGESEVEIILCQLDMIVEAYHRFPTQLEILEIMWPILMSKGDSDIS